MKKLKPNTYEILYNCVEQGIDAGWNKAHKHLDNPSEDKIKEEILRYIMLVVVEKFNFD